MSKKLTWGTSSHPLVSTDPYGHWASTIGRAYLVDYRNKYPGGDARHYAVLKPRPSHGLDPLSFWLGNESASDGSVFYASVESGDTLKALKSLDMYRPDGTSPTPTPSDVDDADPVDPPNRNPFDEFQFIIPLPLRQSSIGRPDQWGDPDWRPPAGLADAKAPVIIGVIDDGIAFCNQRFRLPNNRSRVDFAWIQDGNIATDAKVPFGAEFSRHQIEENLANFQEEDDLLRQFGLADVLNSQQTTAFSRASHGTAMLDLAAGYDACDKDLAFEKRIVSVQLPSLANWDGSGAGLGYFVGWGIEYIFRRARLIARQTYEGTPKADQSIPVLINLSYGTSGGPHNGNHVLERFIERLLDDQRTPCSGAARTAEIVIAAGNSFLQRRHASICAQKKGRHKLCLPWRIGPNDRTSSFLEMWVPHDATIVGLRIAPPGGAPVLDWSPKSQKCGAKELHVDVKDPRNTITRASIDALPHHGDKKRIVIAVAPTDTSLIEPRRPSAPVGLWQIELSAVLDTGEEIEAWVQREEMPFRYPARGGPCYIDDPENVRFTVAGDWLETDNPNAVVKRYGTLSGAATSASPFILGAFRDSDRSSALYSSAASCSMQNWPDAMAACDSSRVLPGVLASGTRSGSKFSINGTSVAAPQVVRLLSENITKVVNDGATKVIEDAVKAGEDAIMNEVIWSPRLPATSALDTPDAKSKDCNSPSNKGDRRRGQGRILPSLSLKTAVQRGRYTGRSQ